MKHTGISQRLHLEAQASGVLLGMTCQAPLLEVRQLL